MTKLTWLGLLLLTCVGNLSLAKASSCQSSGYHSQVKLKQVLDADLIELASGQLVRLIGVQAPLRKRPAEPNTIEIAKQSTAQLQAILDKQAYLNLVLDKALLDNDNHMLAHLFLADGQNVQQLLLQQGAVQLDIQQPNRMFWQCYFQAQLTAMRKENGVWAHADFQAKPAEQARYSTNVSQNWLGRVFRVFEQNQSTWLVLNDWLYVEIPNKVHKKHFKKLNLHQLKGQQVLVDSSVSYKNNRWQALVSEPWQFVSHF